jgi:hypothetical protein
VFKTLPLFVFSFLGCCLLSKRQQPSWNSFQCEHWNERNETSVIQSLSPFSFALPPSHFPFFPV